MVKGKTLSQVKKKESFSFGRGFPIKEEGRGYLKCYFDCGPFTVSFSDSLGDRGSLSAPTSSKNKTPAQKTFLPFRRKRFA